MFEYVKTSDEWMFKDVRDELQVGEKKKYKKHMEKERKECFLGKRLHGKYMRDVCDVADEKSWQWIMAKYVGKGREVYVFAAQE